MTDEQIETLLRDMAAASARMLMDWTAKKSLPIDQLSKIEGGVNKLNRQIMMGR